MLKVTAQQYISLGRQIYEAETSFILQPEPDEDPDTIRKYGAEHELRLKYHLKAMRDMCKQIDLPVSLALLETRLDDLPQTSREFSMLVDAIWSELKGKLFLFIPSDRARYYDLLPPEAVQLAFPNASGEIVCAGNCIATGLFTASVFHSMRALEIGLQAMATALNVTFSYPLALAEWGKIVGEIEPKINELKAGPRSAEKEANLQFYSEAASQFRHFNNGWRVRAAHARANYGKDQAIKVYDHSVSFFQTLSTRLRESLA